MRQIAPGLDIGGTAAAVGQQAHLTRHVGSERDGLAHRDRGRRRGIDGSRSEQHEGAGDQSRFDATWRDHKLKSWAQCAVAPTSQQVNIVGAGLAGSLLAILLARRGLPVTVYERRLDPRTVGDDGGRSINLALAARGIRGLERAGVLDRVMPLTIPMRGRMVHEHDGKAELQLYGVRPEEVIYSVSRAQLNRVLVEAADEFENVDLRFGSEAHGLADTRQLVELSDEAYRQDIRGATRAPTIATDGAGSAMRHALRSAWPHARARGTARPRLQGADHPGGGGRHALEINALHIWPRGGFMLIALPNLDGTFTATLFLAKHGANSFETLKQPRGRRCVLRSASSRARGR